MNKVIALVGNPNCGKTTLFNKLTNSYQRVGNWTGVTTEEKKSKYIKDKNIEIVDLPGLYSLSTDTLDQTNALNYLTKTPPNVIINVLDGTNLERNLSLTVELCSLKIPMIIAVNMCDQLDNNNVRFNKDKLSKIFNIPVINISALKDINIDLLMDKAKTSKDIPIQLDISKEKGENAQSKRFSLVEKITEQVLIKKPLRLEKTTLKLDKILMHKNFGLPIFFIVMTIIYFLTMKVGGFFGVFISSFFEKLSYNTQICLNQLGVTEFIVSLVCDAVINSLGGILSFLPQILILFALIAVIEESGYASRVAFLFDRFFRFFGLSGKSLLPMIVSCGCTVTGLMSTRIIEGESERKMTIFLSPFMPCGAKTAVFAYFSARLFNGNPLIATSMYFLSMLCVGVFGFILKKLKTFKCGIGEFLLEMPYLRVPAIKDVFSVLKEKVKEFMTRAGLIVFAVSVFLWLLKSVGVSGYVGDNVEQSFLFYLGDILKYLFYPLGFFNWQTAVSIISGTFAKEAVVESLSLLSDDVSVLFNNRFSVYAFMAFILLSPPCVASLATAREELKSNKLFFMMMIFQIITAYIVAFIINFIGFLFDVSGGLLLSIIIGIIILSSLIFAIKRLKNYKCNLCAHSCGGGRKCQTKVKRYTT